MDDHTIINGVERGLFRLHPDGHFHRSEGCITLFSHADFDKLRKTLLDNGATIIIPGSPLRAYGTIEVTP